MIKQKEKAITEGAADVLVSTKLVLYDADSERFLLVQRKTSKEWGFIGGTIDGDEELKETLEREVVEEMGDDVRYDLLDAVYAKRRRNRKYDLDFIKIAYLAYYKGGDIALSKEHIKYDWLSIEEIEKGKYTDWVKNSIAKAFKQIEAGESVDRLHRCLADFDNYKKRQAQNQKEFTKYASEGVISDMLPVLDNFHAATEHIPEGESDNPWVTGIMFIQQQMEKVFEESGVAKIEIKAGDEFDPLTMEAVKNDEEEKLNENATVQKIAQPGYKIGEKILRPARVVLK